MLRRFLAAVAVARCVLHRRRPCRRQPTSARPITSAWPARVIHPPVARNWRGAQTEALVTNIWYPVDTHCSREPRMKSARPATLFSRASARSRRATVARSRKISAAAVVARHRRQRRRVSTGWRPRSPRMAISWPA